MTAIRVLVGNGLMPSEQEFYVGVSGGAEGSG